MTSHPVRSIWSNVPDTTPAEDFAYALNGPPCPPMVVIDEAEMPPLFQVPEFDVDYSRLIGFDEFVAMVGIPAETLRLALDNPRASATAAVSLQSLAGTTGRRFV